MEDEYKLIIFICTGNYYRSRLSEELFNYYVQQTDLPWEATSRGLVDSSGLNGISPFAFEFLDRRGLSPHVDPTRNPIRPDPIRPDLIPPDLTRPGPIRSDPFQSAPI